MLKNPRDPMHPAASVDELLDRMSRTGFQGRKLGESYHIWKEMIETPNVTIIIGISGAMIPAGMSHSAGRTPVCGCNRLDWCEHLS